MFERGKISRTGGSGDAAGFPHELRWDELVAQLAATRDLRAEAGRREGASGRFASLNVEHGGSAMAGLAPESGEAAAKRRGGEARQPLLDPPPRHAARAHHARRFDRTSAPSPNQSRERDAQ